MPRIGRPPFTTYLDRIFRAFGETAWPSDVSNVVALTMPWLDPTIVFEKQIQPSESDIGYFSENVVSGAGVASVFGATVPDGFIDILVGADGSHTDPVARDCHVEITFAGVTTVVSLAFALPASRFFPLSRSVVIPAGGVPGVELDAIAAGQTTRIRTSRVRIIPGMGSLL